MGNRSLGVCGLVLALPVSAMAATMTVNSTADNLTAGDGACTLREAIANVNAAADSSSGDCAAGSGSGDAIVFNLSPAAIIVLRADLGALVIEKDVTISGPGSQKLRVDGGRHTRVFEIVAGTTSLADLTIHGGRGILGEDPDFGIVSKGGGVFVHTGATLNLNRCLVAGNIATCRECDAVEGGGIFNQGTVTLTNCRVSANLADGRAAPYAESAAGGGLFNDASGTMTLTGCQLIGNVCVGLFSDNYGGGIMNLGVLTIDNSVLKGNRVGIFNSVFGDGYGGSGHGGGLANDYDGTAALRDCTLNRNRVDAGRYGGDGEGGAISSDGATLTLTNCMLSGNVVRSGVEGGAAGGAISSDSLLMTMTNCTVAENVVLSGAHSGSSGGGISDFGGATLTNCTLYRNKAAGGYATYGGGIDGGGTLTNCTLYRNTVRNLVQDGAGGNLTDARTLINTIIAGGGHAGNCGLDFPLQGGHNLSDDASCFSTDGSNLANTVPKLGPLRSNGGPTKTLPLCTARGAFEGCAGMSPAIDAGDDAVTGPPDNLTTDQRGLPRLSGAHVDIGAYEVP